MEISITQKLREWRAQKSRDDHVEVFKILHNKTIDEIGELLPCTQEEFVAIKGLGGKKFEKYGREILSIVREYTGEVIEEEPLLFTEDLPTEVMTFTESILSVSQYLDLVNSLLNPIKVSVQGEISSFNFNKHAYFAIRDPKEGSLLSCFMWGTEYEICGIEAKDGLEVIVHGFGDVYKPNGKLSFRCLSMELVGEGALKKAYDELKKKLTDEGVFAPERKRDLPDFPVEIGIITSRFGAVIHDLCSNLGKYGYHLRLFDARVEGALATRELLQAIKYFKTESIDLLVVIRGGGSLESLQAFNNESLIRAILDYPVPIICGIGHDRDVPLFSMAADVAVSTPTAVAREINRSWDFALEKLRFYEANILNHYFPMLAKARSTIVKSILQSELFYQKVQEGVGKLRQVMETIVSKFQFLCERYSTKQTDLAKQILQRLSVNLESITVRIDQHEKGIKISSPEKQLKLGYSILFSKEKVIKSVKQVSLQESLKIQVADGEIVSTVDEIISKE